MKISQEDGKTVEDEKDSSVLTDKNIVTEDEKIEELQKPSD